MCLKAGERPEKVMQSARSSRILIRVSLRWYRCRKKTEDDKRKPFLYRHFAKIPEAGQFVFLDTAWMDEITEERLHGTISEDVYANRIESVRRFERQLTDNGYLVMKFFLHISKRNSHSVLHSWSIRRTQHGVSAKKKICGRMNIMRMYGCIFRISEKYKYAIRTLVYH